MKKVLITGALGLVGSEAVKYYLAKGDKVFGVDNNMREYFFGTSVLDNEVEHPMYTHFHEDINDCGHVILAFKPDIIIHCAAQPSHDWSAKDPIMDFQINAMGTLYLLEICRLHVPDCVFIFISTNKVYGDNPNKLPLGELKYRYEANVLGIDETMSVDNCVHSMFGVSKLAADMACQEYGKNYGMKTGTFRCGCITGGRHAGAELHGFLSYVAKCKQKGKVYQIHGYKGKQVRDQIHAYDLVTAFDEFACDPHPGEVYNMGGGHNCNISVLEALKVFNVPYMYDETPRVGDHIWYVSDTQKFERHFPRWKRKYNLEAILDDLIQTRPV